MKNISAFFLLLYKVPLSIFLTCPLQILHFIIIKKGAKGLKKRKKKSNLENDLFYFKENDSFWVWPSKFDYCCSSIQRAFFLLLINVFQPTLYSIEMKSSWTFLFTVFYHFMELCSISI